MIYIDLDADLNVEDDDGRNVTVIPRGESRPRIYSALVAGRPKFWSWVVVDAVEENADGSAVVRFHQVSTKQAASKGSLLVDFPRTGQNRGQHAASADRNT